MSLRLRELRVRFGDAEGLDPISLEVRPGERLALVGQSGEGKTTLLRCIAGLVPAAGGSVEIDGRDVTRLPPERRDAVYLHQTPLLFPHLDVFENVAFPLRVRRVGAAEVQERVGRVLEAMRMQGYGRRQPRTLSGGQKHRVALARAIVAHPSVLLLDEPLSSLDPILREEVRGALADIQREHRPALVLVTHDLDEAGLLADTIGVIVDRRLEQLAPPHEIFARPASLAVARLLGIPNQIPVIVRDGWTLETPMGPLSLASPVPVRGAAVMVFRPDAAVIDPSGNIAGRVTGLRHRAQQTAAVVRAGGAEIEVAVDPLHLPAVGAEVRVSLRPERVLVFPRQQRTLSPDPT